MKVKPIDVALETFEHKKKYFERHEKILKDIKKFLVKFLNDKEVKVILFGSVVRGDFSPLSDIDVLIVSEKVKPTLDEIVKIRLGIKSMLKDFYAPLEIHVASPELFEKWYKRFIDVYKEV